MMHITTLKILKQLNF